MKVRKHIIFYGYVQGVGFRYRTYYAAQRYGVTGYVRNLENGTVEAEFEGEESDIDSVIIEIEKSRYISIERMSVKTLPPVNDSTFEITD